MILATPSQRAANKRQRHSSIGTDLQVLINEEPIRICKLPGPFRQKKKCAMVFTYVKRLSIMLEEKEIISDS